MLPPEQAAVSTDYGFLRLGEHGRIFGSPRRS